MNKIRNFNCRYEEMPVIARYINYSLKRDLADFTAFSPKFDETYTLTLETKIDQVVELVEPNSETIELKRITQSLYDTLNSLINELNHLDGYISLCKSTLNISTSDFGITDLRSGIKSRDAEKVLKKLHVVNSNIRKYQETLRTVGLNDEMITTFVSAEESIAEDKQKQYEIVSNRKIIVQSNLNVFVELYEQLKEIMKIGKILYKGTDPIKTQEYTFTSLKKRVRHEASQENNQEELS